MEGFSTGFGRGFKEAAPEWMGGTGNVIAHGKTANQINHGGLKRETRLGIISRLPQPLQKVSGWISSGTKFLTGTSHTMLKAPIWEAVFKMNRTRMLAHEGLTEATASAHKLAEIEKAAADAAYESIYQNDNWMNKAYTGLLTGLEKDGGGELAAELLRFDAPIVRIPTNIIRRANQSLFGVATTPLRLIFGKAHKEGRLTPSEYDHLIRTFKRSGTFYAMVLLAAAVPGAIQVGGLYRQRDKRKPGDLEPGDVAIFGHKLPHAAAHHDQFVAANALGMMIRDVSDEMAKKQGLQPGSLARTVAGITTTLSVAANTEMRLAGEVPMIGTAADIVALTKGSKYDVEAAKARLGASFVPAPLRLIRQAEDPTRRKAAGFWQGVQSNIPRVPGVPWLPSSRELDASKYQPKH